MSDKLFEKRMNKILKVLKEQEGMTTTGAEPTAAATQQALPFQDPRIQGTDVAATQLAQQGRERIARQQAGQDVARGAQAEKPEAEEPVRGAPKPVPGKKVQFLSTNDMYTTPPPPDSADWPNEVNKKRWLLPLKDGRVGRDLLKHISETFRPTGPHGAARYSDFQFRIILRGDLNANATISTEIKPDDKVLFRLVELGLDTPFTPKGKIATVDKTQFQNREGVSKPIEIKTNTGDFFEQYRQGTLFTKGEIESLKRRAVPPKEEAPEEEAPEEEAGRRPAGTKEEKPEFFDEVWKTAIGKQGYLAKETKTGIPKEATESDIEKAKKWAREVIEKYKPENEKEAALLGMIGSIPKKEKEESIKLSDYLKDLLLEKKKQKKPEGGELERELGGALIRDLNEKLFKQWFGVDKVAATTRRRIFEGAIWEWFACDGATFRAKERKDVTETAAGNLKLEFVGTLTMEAEVWIDARCGENGDTGTWTFRAHDKPNTPFLIKKFKSFSHTTKKSGLKKGE